VETNHLIKHRDYILIRAVLDYCCLDGRATPCLHLLTKSPSSRGRGGEFCADLKLGQTLVEMHATRVRRSPAEGSEPIAVLPFFLCFSRLPTATWPLHCEPWNSIWNARWLFDTQDAPMFNPNVGAE